MPAGLEVHLVCDNLATHKTPAIQDWLARHPRFRLHFTPTGSSWINQVERWFGFLTDQMIRRGVHKSVQALEADIRAWIENWNQNPRPLRRVLPGMSNGAPVGQGLLKSPSGRWLRCPSSLSLLPRCSHLIPARPHRCGTGWRGCRIRGTGGACGSLWRA